MLNIIGALDKPSSGKVILNNIDIFTLHDKEISILRNLMIGFIFQSYNLINRTTVLKNVEISGLISGMDIKERKEKAIYLLDLLGLSKLAYSKITKLSGGQQQRVAIARALMNDPELILADEPTGNLDTKNGNEVFQLLQILAKKFKTTIIMVTHNLELAKNTDRIISIKDGKIQSN